MKLERTLAIIKPDGVTKGLIGEVIKRIENERFKILQLKMVKLSKEEAKGFYIIHEDKPFYESLTDFIASSPIVVMILEGENVIQRYRTLMGATDYQKAEKGTIRYDFASSIQENIVHGSDSQSSADFEIRYFFPELELQKK